MFDEEDKRKFKQEIGQYMELIKNICYSYGGYKVYSYQDLLQETLLNLWVGFNNGVEKENMLAYVYRTTINTVRYYSRKNDLKNSVIKRWNECEEDDSAVAEEKMELYDIMVNLSNEERDLFQMVLNDFTMSEIAEALETTEKKAMKKWESVKTKIAKILERR
ncbi:MAG: RNA polymerase sigma factor [Bacteroidales bacterium]|nr:RNA polymerase sigma factor [Bacteroidales bacterium]MBQ9313331.1 RNA polymerase sigma factor [Bacteroidales bacterium]